MTVPGCNYQTSPYFAYELPEGVPGGGVPGLGCPAGLGSEGDEYLPNAAIPPGTPGSGGWWDLLQRQIASWSKTGQQILLSREIPRGVYTRTGPGGTITYVQPAGQQPSIFTGGEAAASGFGPGFGMVLLAGGVFLVVLMMAGKGRK